MELEDSDAIEDIMENSESQANWNQMMAGILEDDDNVWMDDVYWMI